MPEKNKLIFRIVLGGFLAYQGIQLLSIPVQERPDNFIMLAICGMLFLTIGVLFIFRTIKNYIRESKENDIEMISYDELKNDEPKQKEGADESCE